LSQAERFASINVVSRKGFQVRFNLVTKYLVKYLKRSQHTGQSHEIGGGESVTPGHSLFFHKQHYLLDESIFFYGLQEFIEIVPSKLAEAHALGFGQNFVRVFGIVGASYVYESLPGGGHIFEVSGVSFQLLRPFP